MDSIDKNTNHASDNSPASIDANLNEASMLESLRIENQQLALQLQEKNRELEIEEALEKVRARSLAMHHSVELEQVAKSLFEQLTTLGLQFDGSLIFVFNKERRAISLRIATSQLPDPIPIHLPFEKEMQDNEIIRDLWHAYETGTTIINKSYSGDSKNNYFRYVVRNNETQVPPDVRRLQLEAEKWNISCVGGKNSVIALDSWSGAELSAKDVGTLTRFSKVFEQAFTRFLDLEKAEAQARESQIEAALERVRSRAMAMHQSDELKLVARELRSQMGLLGTKELETCAINLYDNDITEVHSMAATNVPGSETGIIESDFHFPKKGIAIIEEVLNAYESGAEEFIVMNEGAKSTQWMTELSRRAPEVFEIVAESTGFNTNAEIQVWWTCAFFKGGALIMITMLEPDAASRVLLKKFAHVFGLAYRRFADLKNAEAQARESQIEAALETIRSRSLAMHRSDELKEVIDVLFKKLNDLKVLLGTVGIQLFDQQSGNSFLWVGNAIQDPQMVNLPYDEQIMEGDTYVPDGWRAMLAGDDIINKEYTFEQKEKFFDYVFANNSYTQVPEEARQMLRQLKHHVVCLITEKYSALFADSFDAGYFKESDINVLRRASMVFEQAYIRFLDLQKAEALAREASIEAALERLRTKTMAMNNSDDVGDTVATMFAEFVQLGIHTNRCGILIFDDEDKGEVWTARSNADGKATLIIGELNLNAHDLLKSAYYAWKDKQSAHHYHLHGADLINYYDAINRLDLYPVKFDLNKLPPEEFHFDFYFPDGAVFSFTMEPIAEGHSRIMKRFAGVFGQTYRRYLDLQKAETSAKEAIKQAALDRIRADIASMRTKQDLDRITPVIWNELTTLNIPFIRCGIFIMDDNQHLIHTFLSTPEGRAIASFNLHYDHSVNISDIVHHWQNDKTYVEHWQIEDFTALADSLVQLGEIATREQYLQSLPPGGIYLHCVPFLQGMLYAGSLTQFSDSDINLLQVVAEAFSTAYARYEDFNKVEKSLADLRQAQAQLIQAEKMASLGELTAGIAHEIQNPLNFVNNFSEVNKDLLEEVKSQKSKVKNEELDDLLDDIFLNNEKILHHGKRADAIVKGMLQHSRSSSGAKEPTDINALAEEYLRLAYHGLRAKDHSFNAVLNTTFDDSIAHINIIPQDIGRVLLNLINNAFYAVDVKRRSSTENFDPIVSVSTKKVTDKVEISIADNGPGIPKKILDKIFQPFFTTKPTGEGTGLGLSLSYDIVKAHGGEIRVESKEGEGSVFTVIL